MTNPDTLLRDTSKITLKYAKTLEKMGLVQIKDLFFHFPFRYDDFSKNVTASNERLGQTITITGKIVKTKNRRIFPKRMTVTEATLQDEDNNPIKVVWFNQPFILDSLKIGSLVRVSGKLELDGKVFCMKSPEWERAERDETNTGRLVPVYSETSGVTSKWIRWQIKLLLPIARQIEDVLPFEIRKKFNLFDIFTALGQIHFPDSRENLIRAQKRFAFQEMFLVQLHSLRVKNQWEKNRAIRLAFDKELVSEFVSNLPFKLTDAQRKASFEILKDMEKPRPMNRLLEGDVGSGKTVVAAIASLQAAVSGFQVAIMAPTEVLARQHFESFSRLLEDYDLQIGLLTNSYQVLRYVDKDKNISSSYLKKSERKILLDKIISKEVDIVIGTHALIQKDVIFRNLALVIIDEQHRFGVSQRAFLQQETMEIADGESSSIPHLLTMTATPIPRTLAIAFFGSLDLSILDEMPKNRKPIITKIITPKDREKIYAFIKSQVESGRQAFVIFPLIEESEALSEIKAATTEYERLSREVFPEFKLGLMHGKLKPKEKERVMKKFKERETNILISTSVVEVGIDVANATVMIIENAERFGLSQLHQFRGRVGRGEHQSYCFLFTDSTSGKSSARLKALEKTEDGFEISKIDLELRGPGQFFGTAQSGLPDIAMENLTNVKLIKLAREEAANILRSDPELKKHPFIADALRIFSDKIHLE